MATNPSSLSNRPEDFLDRDLARQGIPILDHSDLTAEQAAALRGYFDAAVKPILPPLAVDAAHAAGEETRAAQEIFIRRAAAECGGTEPAATRRPADATV